MIVNIWINCPSADVAATIAKGLLERRLVPAANQYPEIRSCYVWRGEATGRDAESGR